MLKNDLGTIAIDIALKIIKLKSYISGLHEVENRLTQIIIV